ncbi:MAG: FkbM family methyltransferase [Deltaproteobacteria bacterium]|nr:FkbM family methyltransferase [Deltaproteobacteria bacterium]
MGKYRRVARRALSALLRRDHSEWQRQKRLLAFYLLQGEAETVTFVREGTEWTVFAEGDSMFRDMFVDGGYQAAETAAVVRWAAVAGRLAADKHVIIDVGANIGMTSIVLAQLTEKRILAIEPVPQTFDLLRRNVARNGLDHRIDCVQAAVCSHDGRTTMVRHPRCGNCEVKTAGGEQGFGPLTSAHDLVEVPAKRLEALLSHDAPAAVGLVWSDTQGFERHVVLSGGPLWRAGVPLYVELWPAGLAAHGGVAAFVQEAQAHFSTMVLRDELVHDGAQASRLPLSQLPAVLAALGERTTDALFIP